MTDQQQTETKKPLHIHQILCGGNVRVRLLPSKKRASALNVAITKGYKDESGVWHNPSVALFNATQCRELASALLQYADKLDDVRQLKTEGVAGTVSLDAAVNEFVNA